MTPEEQAAAAAAAAATAPPVFDYLKLDYSKLDYSKMDLTKLSTLLAAGDQRKKDADAVAATALAADEKRKADEATALAAGRPKPWNVKEAPEFLKLQADLAAKVAQDEVREKRAELKERTGTVKAALGDYTFATPGSKAVAEKLFLTDIKLADDGETYVGPDGSPADQYIARTLETEMDYLLKAKDVGGSGARNGGSRKDSAVDIDAIKVGMKPDALQAARAEISRVLNGR